MPGSITIPVIDFFIHPPVGALTSQLDLIGPYTGVQTLDHFQPAVGGPVPIAESYGFHWIVNGPIPPRLGLLQGWSDPLGQFDTSEYSERLLQVVVQYLAFGTFITTEIHDFNVSEGNIFWDAPGPARIGVVTLPGVAFDFFYYQL